MMAADHRYDHVGDRLKEATLALLTDQSLQGQTLLGAIVSTELFGDELLDAIEIAEQYVKERNKQDENEID